MLYSIAKHIQAWLRDMGSNRKTWLLAVCAALIGACYLASFCTAKRAIARAAIAANGTWSSISRGQAEGSALPVSSLSNQKPGRLQSVRSLGLYTPHKASEDML